MQYNLIRSSPIKNSFLDREKEGVLKMEKHSFYNEERNFLTMSRQGVGFYFGKNRTFLNWLDSLKIFLERTST